MATITKTGNFSKKYNYIKSSEEEYFLIEKSKSTNICSLIGKKLPSAYGENCRAEKTDKNIFSFNVRPVHLAAYCLVCVIISCLLFDSYPSFVFLLWSLNLHEFSHIIIGMTFKSGKMKFGMKVKYGFFLMLYISNSLVYEYSKRQRIFYYLAGVLTNLCICGFSQIVYLLCAENYVQDWCQNISSMNIMLALLNICPFLFTDGFNVLREILEDYTLRDKIKQNFFRPGKIVQYGKTFVIYYIFVVFSWCAALFRLFHVIFEFFVRSK